MVSQGSHPTKHSLLKALCAGTWILGFLYLFFIQELPNNSPGPDDPLTRLDVRDFLLRDAPLILNPFDYSSRIDADAGWHNLGQRLPFMAVAGFLLTAAWGMGRVVTDSMCGMQSLLRSERLVLDTGIGISVLTLWILLCGVGGYLNQLSVAMPILCLIAVGIRMYSSRKSEPLTCQLPSAPEETASGISRWLVVLAVPFVLHIFLGGMTPPFDFDVREYHMQGPKEWFQAGRIFTLEHNVYTSFPFLSEMLSLGAMVLHDDWWAGAISGKLALCGFQFLSAMCVYAIGRRWLGKTPGVIGALVLLSTPWTVRISVIAYAEGAASFYLIATVMTGLLARKASGTRTQNSLWAATGFLAGSAMAAKYPGVLSTVIPAGILLVAGTLLTKQSSGDTGRVPGRRLMWTALIFSMAVFAAVGPWLIKNLAATGNPVYPLAYSVFGAEDWSEEMDAKWKRAHSAAEHDPAGIPRHLMDVAVRSDWQNGLLFAFAVPSLLLTASHPVLRWLWLHVVWLLGTWWAFTHRIDRFWVPVIPVISVLAGSVWLVNSGRLWRSFLPFLITACCLYNYGFCRLPLVGYHAGLTDMATVRKQPVRNDISVLNKTLPDTARILMVGEAEVFDVRFDSVYSTVFDECIFEQWTSAEGQTAVPREDRKMKPAESIRSVLATNGITHVYVNWSEILRYRLTYGYTPYVYPERFEQLLSHGILLPPVTLSTGEWDRLSSQQQQQVLSWSGGEGLRREGGYWANILLYRVSR